MKNTRARFSYEKRVKLIIFFMAAALLFAAFSLRAFSSSDEEYTEPPGRTNYLLTSNNPEAYSVIECSGKTITLKGRYSLYGVRSIYIKNHREDSGSYSFQQNADGSYEAVLTMEQPQGKYDLVIMMNSGYGMVYPVYYTPESGWFFPVNGLEATNRRVFDHIFEAPAEAAALYLSATEDPEEINAALEQIKALADSAAEGIDDDYQKARAISLFIAQNIYYDFDARHDNVDIDTIALSNVLKRSRTTCGGFANLFGAMAEAAGLDAVNIKGGTIANDDGELNVTYDQLPTGRQNHEFAAFWYEKEQRWVWVDACWDSMNEYVKSEYNENPAYEKFFDVTDEALAQNHRADRAERRSYFSAKIGTAPLTGPGEADTLTSSAEPEDQTSPETASQTEETVIEETLPAETSAAQQTAPAAPQESEDNTIPIVIIAVLAAAVIGAAAAVVLQIKKRKETQNMEKVVIELENGKKIKIELFDETAPITTANFRELVSGGFYDGLTFHRVIPGFMIQGGCPHGNGTGNSGKHIKGEFAANGVDNPARHTRGIVSMARATDPDSASCQFFIMHKDAPHLDGNYAAFGRVVEGMDAVDEIAETETDYADKPVTPVIMKRVYIEKE